MILLLYCFTLQISTKFKLYLLFNRCVADNCCCFREKTKELLLLFLWIPVASVRSCGGITGVDVDTDSDFAVASVYKIRS